MTDNDAAQTANVRLRTEPSIILQLSFNAPAQIERPTAMMASGIAEKFISSYLGKGTLAPAVRSADAKVSRANRRGEHHGPRSSAVADRHPHSDHPSDLAVWRTSLDVRTRPVRRAATE